ncbi:MAG: hypothetical protein HY341_01605 [Candidatus Kerfeldbacteria bacterium]|nr:hypothetical protein [Candidatus Kerfeldbacteria bacterium]
MPESGVGNDVLHETEYVGETFHYYSMKSAVALHLLPGKRVANGDLLRFGRKSKRPYEMLVFSIELDRQKIELAEGPIAIGIEVSRRVENGTPVYLVSRVGA